MTDIVRSRETFSILANLEAAGVIDEVSLTLTDPDLPFGTWLGIGRALGVVDRASRWHIGDWLNFGDDLYGETASQAIESTPQERYDVLARVTGLEHQVIINIASICRRVPRSRRRPELGFWIHAEVAKLDPQEQAAWLEQTVREGWRRAELRAAVKEATNPSDDSGPEPDGPVAEPRLSVAERIEAAARVVFQTASKDPDGDYRVPEEAWAQLRAALGEE